MDENRWLAERFEAHRAPLRAAAYRMPGSLGEAEDAVQESWLHLALPSKVPMQRLLPAAFWMW
ncbi:sigma factor [Sorangium sp. So ce260]|uniref:sigma factor n=1 Tax=Sorangium sp. So ce260 TaxID=3133291 RepID=UPI003F631634